MLPKVSSSVLILFSFSTSRISCPLSLCLFFFLQMSSPHPGPPASSASFPLASLSQRAVPSAHPLALSGLLLTCPVILLWSSSLTKLFASDEVCLCVLGALSLLGGQRWSLLHHALDSTLQREQVIVNISQIPGVKRHSGAWEMAEPGLLGKFLCNAALVNRVTTHYWQM